jgi:exodeoxyribonuclease VII large subunit
MGDGFTLFDPDKARGASDRPDVGKDVTGDILGQGPAGGPMSVSALLARVKAALAGAFPGRLSVVGEISNFKRHASGHLYFRLKDAHTSIDVAMFKSAASRLKYAPSDGMEVVIDGRVDVYEVRGQLQFYAEAMTPKGTGALELAFRQLRARLEAEGLFDASRKKPVPRFPRAIGVITSATGAAVRDVGRTLRRRWPAAGVFLVPVLVQGEEAAGQIAEAIRLLDAAAERFDIDTIIVGRGGGSLEDLWAFNEEVVARAVAAARTPIISGVGHEVDVTICDLVADVRAATPTAAAELAAPDRAEVRASVANLGGRVARAARQAFRQSAAQLDAVRRSAVFRDPAARLRTRSQHVDELSHRLGFAARDTLNRARRRLSPAEAKLAALHPARLAERARARLAAAASRMAWVLGGRCKRAGDSLAAKAARLAAAHPRHRLALGWARVRGLKRQLDSMSYRSVLRRGYSVTRLAGGEIIRSAGQAVGGTRVSTELADGQFTSTVDGPRPRPAPPTPTEPRRGLFG